MVNEEPRKLSELLLNFRNLDGTTRIIYANPNYMGNVLNEANWAANQLQIPRAFVLSQWLMEAGLLTGRPSQTAIANNNLGGILDKSKIRRFPDLHSFSIQYVSILRKDGIGNNDDFSKIVKTLHQKHYVVGESPNVYGNKIMGTLSFLKDASPECGAYYKKCLSNKHLHKLKR